MKKNTLLSLMRILPVILILTLLLILAASCVQEQPPSSSDASLSSKSETPLVSTPIIFQSSSEASPSEEPIVSPSDPSTEPTPEPSESPVTSTETPSKEEPPALFVNEIMASNSLFPIEGALCDWLELYNASKEDIDLSDYFISNDINQPHLAKLPSITLEAGGYCLLKSEKELPFRLSKQGESIYITRSDGVLVTSVTYEALEKNTVWTPDLGIIDFPSPGYSNSQANSATVISERTGLILSEIISSNTKYQPFNKNYCDIVELYNRSDSEILLSDYYLTDKESDPKRYRLPEIKLEPGAYYLVHCDKSVTGAAPINISSSGENLWLTREDGFVSDALCLPFIPVDRSWGRSNGKLVYFSTPSLGKSNGDGFETLTPDPSSSVPAGIYADSVKLTLSGEGKIYYTLDGSAPTTASKLYSGEEILLQKSTAVRAIAYDGEKIPSASVTFPYIIIENTHELPVAHLSTDSNALFGEDGIYTNYLSKDEIAANITFFDKGIQQFSVNCGLKIFGGGSRELPKKSFQLKFRAKYGTAKLKYDLFDSEIQEFNSLVLRSGEDYKRSIIRDELQTWIADHYDMELLTQDFRYCVLYINGEYFGIYCFKERIDEDFVAAHTGDPADDISIVMSIGTTPEYTALVKYIEEHDLSVDEHFQYVKARINLESMADWMIAEMYVGNRDLQNFRCYKGSDGKWNFIFFDLDWGFNSHSTHYETYYHTGVSSFFSRTSKIPKFQTILNGLLENPEFEDLFYTRLAHCMSKGFDDETILGKIDEMAELLESEVTREKERWGSGYNKWTAYVQELRDFVTARGTSSRRIEIIKQAIEYFEMDDETVLKYFGEDFLEKE